MLNWLQPTDFLGALAAWASCFCFFALDSQSSRRNLTQGITELLVPFFLVGIGLYFDLAAFATWPTVLLAFAMLVAAVISKLLGCGFGAYSQGRQDAIRVGVGMIPRGEVGMIVAQIGSSLGVVGDQVYAVVVFMSVATTVPAPPLLRWAFRDSSR